MAQKDNPPPTSNTTIVYDGAIYNSQRRGGISRYFTRLIENVAWLQPEWRIELHVNPQQGVPVAPLPNGSNVRVRTRPYLRPRLPCYPFNAAAREWMWRAARPSLLHSTLYRQPIFSPCPVVTTIHDVVEILFPQLFSGNAGHLTAQWKRRSAETAEAVIAVSMTSKSDIVRLFGIDPQKVHVVYHGIDERFSKRPLAAEGRCRQLGVRKPYLLYVGQREQHKNFKVLWQAFQSSELKAWNLVLVGGADRLEAWIDPTSVQGRLIHLSDVSDEDLLALYAEADFLIFPSLYEGFGFPALEAMACGTGVIASDIPSTREVCRDACRYFDPNDQHSLVNAIVAAAKAETTIRLIEAGRRQAMAYTWRKCARETLAIYTELIGARRTPKNRRLLLP